MSDSEKESLKKGARLVWDSYGLYNDLMNHGLLAVKILSHCALQKISPSTHEKIGKVEDLLGVGLLAANVLDINHPAVEKLSAYPGVTTPAGDFAKQLNEMSKKYEPEFCDKLQQALDKLPAWDKEKDLTRITTSVANKKEIHDVTVFPTPSTHKEKTTPNIPTSDTEKITSRRYKEILAKDLNKKTFTEKESSNQRIAIEVI